MIIPPIKIQGKKTKLVPKIMEYVIKDIAKGIDKTCREAEEEITKKMNDDKYLKELVETVMKENTHE